MALGDPTRLGVVNSFDAVVGLGEVSLDDGRSVAFHATAIADGSRSIGVGAVVRVTLGPSLGGVHEARSIALDSPSFPCPVCRHAVPGDAETYEICPCCGWEDDPVQRHDPSYGGGANGTSLDEARAHWLLRDDFG